MSEKQKQEHEDPAAFLQRSQQVESKLFLVDQELEEAITSIVFTGVCFEQLDKTLMTREKALKEVFQRRAATRREVHLVQQLKQTPEGQFLEMVKQQLHEQDCEQHEQRESKADQHVGSFDMRYDPLAQLGGDHEIESKVSAFVAALNRKKRR
eukprot:764151-Hanusia_phi.AAC.1